MMIIIIIEINKKKFYFNRKRLFKDQLNLQMNSIDAYLMIKTVKKFINKF